MLTSLAAWPRRRWLAAAVLLPVVGALLVAAADPAAALAPGLLWWSLLAVTVLAGAGILASYVPARGWRPELGCTPCAAVAGLTLVAALMALDGSAGSVTGPALAAAVTLFGLTQRLGQPTVCASPAGPPPPREDDRRA